MKSRITPRLPDNEIEKIPLRHEGEELALGGQGAELRHGERESAEFCLERAGFLVRECQELGQQAELMDELERRGVDGVAAEIAQEIGVLLQHGDIDAGPRQQEA